MINHAYLLTGSNVGNREMNLLKAGELIQKESVIIVKTSSVYETAPWGQTDQPAFLNQALEIKTSLSARQLMRKILKIEKMMGRIRLQKYGPRLIDIDILLFNGEQHNYPLLKLPHPEMTKRRFALLPLAEIAPLAHHPVFKKTIRELLNECPDDLPVKKYS
jgi:2-amino-4-hydroxy-6-hydroxymethyldihydropteridine diphosphokinase